MTPGDARAAARSSWGPSLSKMPPYSPWRRAPRRARIPSNASAETPPRRESSARSPARSGVRSRARWARPGIRVRSSSRRSRRMVTGSSRARRIPTRIEIVSRAITRYTCPAAPWVKAETSLSATWARLPTAQGLYPRVPGAPGTTSRWSTPRAAASRRAAALKPAPLASITTRPTPAATAPSASRSAVVVFPDPVRPSKVTCWAIPAGTAMSNGLPLRPSPPRRMKPEGWAGWSAGGGEEGAGDRGVRPRGGMSAADRLMDADRSGRWAIASCRGSCPRIGRLLRWRRGDVRSRDGSARRAAR